MRGKQRVLVGRQRAAVVQWIVVIGVAARVGAAAAPIAAERRPRRDEPLHEAPRGGGVPVEGAAVGVAPAPAQPRDRRGELRIGGGRPALGAVVWRRREVEGRQRGGGGGGGGGGQEGESGVIETELYRLFDVTTSEYHSSQTKGVLSGHLVFVRQGKYGALSLMIVGGRGAGGPPEDEFTILIRGC